MNNKYKGLSKKDLIGIIKQYKKLIDMKNDIPKPKQPPKDQICKECGKSCFVRGMSLSLEDNSIISNCCYAEVIFKDKKENEMIEKVEITGQEAIDRLNKVHKAMDIYVGYKLKVPLFNGARKTSYSESKEKLNEFTKSQNIKINIDKEKLDKTFFELMKSGDITIVADVINTEPQQPKIIKSGDTWVAEYKGVDYLWNGKLDTDMEENQKCFNSNKEGFNVFLEEDLWKPISEIEITDEIAKLRPMVMAFDSQEPKKCYPDKLLGVVDSKHSYRCISTGWKQCRLATVKDLEG